MFNLAQGCVTEDPDEELPDPTWHELFIGKHTQTVITYIHTYIYTLIYILVYMRSYIVKIPYLYYYLTVYTRYTHTIPLHIRGAWG